MSPLPYSRRNPHLLSIFEAYEAFVEHDTLPPGNASPFEARITPQTVRFIRNFEQHDDVPEDKVEQYLDTRRSQETIVAIIKTSPFPFFNICTSHKTVAAIFRQWSPLPQLLTCLIPDSSSVLDNSAGYVATRSDDTRLELGFTIYYCQQRNDIPAITRATFYFSQTLAPIAEEELDRWMYFGDEDIFTWVTKGQGQPMTVDTEVRAEHARMHRVIALVSSNGWRQAISQIEQSIAKLARNICAGDDYHTDLVCASDGYHQYLSLLSSRDRRVNTTGIIIVKDVANAVRLYNTEVNTTRTAIQSNLAVIEELCELYKEPEWRASSQLSDSWIGDFRATSRVLKRDLARLEYLQKELDNLREHAKLTHNSRAETLEWHNLKLKYSSQTSMSFRSICTSILLSGIFTSTLFSTYYFPTPATDEFDIRGFQLWIAIFLPLSALVLALYATQGVVRDKDLFARLKERFSKQREAKQREEKLKRIVTALPA